MDRLQATWLCVILAVGLAVIALSVYLGCRVIAGAIRQAVRAGRRADRDLDARDFASPTDSPDGLP